MDESAGLWGEPAGIVICPCSARGGHLLPGTRCGGPGKERRVGTANLTGANMGVAVEGVSVIVQ